MLQIFIGFCGSSDNKMRIKAIKIFCVSVFVITIIVLYTPALIWSYEDESSNLDGNFNQSTRVNHLNAKCQLYKDPFRPERAALYGSEPNKLGVEVVYLKGGPRSRTKPMISVCIPHKVGSHAFGQFSRLSEMSIDQSQLDLPWTVKSELSFRAVVVRHPLERLVSVYRMIFQDWCDEKRFLAKQWNNVCVSDFEDEPEKKGFIEDQGDQKNRTFSGIQFLMSMADEARYGNDRYIKKIWQAFHPGRSLVNPKAELKFTFSQFVRFITNASAYGEDVLNHQGLKYHWQPYWQECSLCSPKTRPHMILRMESLHKDLEQLLIQGGHHPSQVEKLVQKFPHTHSQNGGHSRHLSLQFYSQLNREQVKNLIDLYRLDLELFGYDATPYISAAKF